MSTSQLAGTDMSPSAGPQAFFHMFIQFNLDRVSEFYFGTDSMPPVTQWDFVQICSHELGHGLGFFDSTQLDSSQPNYRGNYESPTKIFQQKFVADPLDLDLFVSWDSLNSAERGVLLSSGSVFFDGSTYTRPAALAYGGAGVISPGYAEVKTGDAVTLALGHWHDKHTFTLLMEPFVPKAMGFWNGSE